jgi:hypothetical protein
MMGGPIRWWLLGVADRCQGRAARLGASGARRAAWVWWSVSSLIDRVILAIYRWEQRR